MNKALLALIIGLIAFITVLMISVYLSLGSYRYCEADSDCAGIAPASQCNGSWFCDNHMCRYFCYAE